jgi:hypothetical protein
MMRDTAIRHLAMADSGLLAAALFESKVMFSEATYGHCSY